MTADTRDEVAAQRFGRRRLRAALVQGDPDSLVAPLSRLGAGVYGGLAITVLLLAVAGIVGVLRPGGSTAWQEPGAFIVDEDTGARYVFRDGVLHPILNYASARLLLGDQLQVVTVSSASLDPAVRGPMIGIPLAPDALPDAAQIVGVDWSVCAVGRAADGAALHTEVRPGSAAAGSTVPDSDGYLVRTESGRTALIWSGQAHDIPDQWLEALGYQNAVPIRVPDSFVAALPAGAPLAPATIAGVGEPGPALPGSVQPTIVGTIYADRTNAFYVLTRTGLASLTPLQAQLLLADPAINAAYPGSSPTPLKVSQAQVTEAAPGPLPAAGPSPDTSTDPTTDPTTVPSAGATAEGGPVGVAPATAPEPATLPPGEQQLCVRYLGSAVTELVVGPAESTGGAGESAADGSTAGGSTADGSAAAGTSPVRLAPGTGALIAEPVGADGAATAVSLVTDSGIRYPLSGQRALEALGLAGAPVARLPAELIATLPVGPTLDPAAAAAAPAP